MKASSKEFYSKEFGVFLFRQSSYWTPLRKHIHLNEFKRSWFLIGGFRSVLFVTMFHWVRCLVWGNHRLIFLIFVTCKNKVMSASFPRQKFN